MREFVAPLGVDVSKVDGIRAAARTSLRRRASRRSSSCASPRGAARVRAGTALRTLALLAERHPDLRLALVGPGADEEDVHMHAAALGVSSLVHFLGERDDLPIVLAAADVGWVAADGDDGGVRLPRLHGGARADHLRALAARRALRARRHRRRAAAAGRSERHRGGGRVVPRARRAARRDGATRAARAPSASSASRR